MKKLISILLAIFLIGTFSVTTFAEEEKFEKMKNLNNYWAINDAYPDWFCGVWTETGSLNNLVVAVLDTEEGNRGKQEILDLIEDDSSVTFTYGDYSRNYLIGVKESFTYETFQELGLSYTAFLDTENRVELGILKEKRDDPASLQKLEELKEQYGDIFTVKYVDGYASNDILYIEDLPVVTNTGSIVEVKTQPSYFLYIAVAVSLLLSVTCIFVLLKRRRAFALQTSAGHAVNTSSPLSTKEVESIVRNTEAEVPSNLEEKILKAIEDKE